MRAVLKLGLRIKFILMFMGVTALVLALACGLFYQKTSEFSLGQLRERLQEEVSMVASVLDGDQHQSVKKQDDAPYLAIQRQLRTLRQGHGNVKDLYTMVPPAEGPKATVWAFWVDAEDASSSLFSPLGATYDVTIDPSLYQGWEHPAVSEGLYTDEYGTWLSAYAPIKGHDGSVKALVGMDMSAKGFLARQMSLFGTILWTYVGGMVLAAIAAYLLASRLTGPLEELKTVGDRLSEGDLAVTVSGKSQAGRDELGALAQAFARTTGYLQGVGTIAQAVGQGDLTTDWTPRGPGDRLGQAIAQMITSLRGIVARVRGTAREVGGSATGLQETSAQLARSCQAQEAAVSRTRESVGQIAQASARVQESVAELTDHEARVGQVLEHLELAVSQTHASISELASSIHQIAHHVSEADAATGQVMEQTREGARAVSETVSDMERSVEALGKLSTTISQLETASREIGAIVDAIDEISDQTNLLALNAAIEAARAGEAGRGFAVVADEVRKLANRASEATRDIQGRIAAIQRETGAAVAATHEGVAILEAGATRATRAGASLDRVREALSGVQAMMGEITLSTREQSHAADLIVRAAGEIETDKHAVRDALTRMIAMTEGVQGAADVQHAEAEAVVNHMRAIAEALDRTDAAYREVDALAQTLVQQARELMQEVERFDLGEAVTARVPLALR